MRHTDRSARSGPTWDPTDSSIDGPYTTAINEYLRNDLRYSPSIPYRSEIYDIIYADGNEWDFSHDHHWPTNVAPDLADAMMHDFKRERRGAGTTPAD